MDPHRALRLSEALREELEELLAYEMADPRIDVAGVSEVLVSPDGRHARARLILTSDPESQKITLEALKRATPYIRTELGQRLTIYRIPEIAFESAISPELGTRVGHLLKRVRKGRPRSDDPPEDAAEKKQTS